MGIMEEAERETAGWYAVKGTAASNAANQGGTNTPERQATTHQQRRIGVKGSTSTGGMY